MFSGIIEENSYLWDHFLPTYEFGSESNDEMKLFI